MSKRDENKNMNKSDSDQDHHSLRTRKKSSLRSEKGLEDLEKQVTGMSYGFARPLKLEISRTL